MPKWDCSRTADFFTELENLFKRYGLDKDDICKEATNHLDSCQSCKDKIEKLEDKYEPVIF